MIEDAEPLTTVPAVTAMPEDLARSHDTSASRLERALGASPDVPSPVSEESHDDGTPPPNPIPPPQQRC